MTENLNVRKMIDLALASKAMSNVELAKNMNINTGNVSKMKSRKRLRPKSLANLAKGLGMSIEELMKFGEKR